MATKKKDESKMIGFRLSKEEFKQFEKAAKECGVSVSMFCRLGAFEKLRATQ